MKKTTIAIIVAAIAVFSFSSCKKGDKGPGGRAGEVVGAWTLTHDGYDDNKNGIWEASEKDTVTDLTVVYKFDSDGTGSVIPGGKYSTFTWSLFNNDNDMILTGPGPDGMDTINFNIVSLSGNALIVRDTTNTPSDYYQFSR